MDSHGSGYDDHSEEHGIHLPDPSIWPIVVGAASLIAGFALIWWSNDRNSHIAGPLLGVGVVAVLISIAGWAYEDGRMRTKAEAGHGADPRPVRFTQVLTFALAEGQAAAGRGVDGVVTAIDRSDLRDLEGFQDLRITLSPDTGGPSTVLVETTWRGRDGINAYESTRQTLLDVVNAHADQVVAGSVQVFDMEVLRDTKDTSFKFSLGAAATVIGGLAIAAFVFGAGLNLFAKESKAATGGGATPVAADPYSVTATDNKFGQSTLRAQPNADVTFKFTNKGAALHNLTFLDKKGGTAFKEGGIIGGGKSEEVSFKAPAAGKFYFQCDVHPDQMFGTFEVTPDAPPAGGAPAAAAAGTGGTPVATDPYSVTATDNKFGQSTLRAQPNADVTFKFTNKGAALHSLTFLDKKGGTAFKEGAIIGGGKSEEVSFKAPAAGKYYFQCDVHPDQMFGTFEVTADAPAFGAAPAAGATPAGSATGTAAAR